MFVFPTVDGCEKWEADFDLSALSEAEDALGKLRQALNKIHRHEEKSFLAGLTLGIETYLHMLSMGKRK